jgi:hypothetical protein
MASKKSRLSAKYCERATQRRVTLFNGSKKAVVRRALLGFLPGTLDGVKIWRVRREAMQLDAMTVSLKPFFTLLLQIVAWAVVNDEEYFAPRVLHEVLKKLQKRQAIEYRRKDVVELRFFFQRHCAENMCCLALTKGINLRLLAYLGPCAV